MPTGAAYSPVTNVWRRDFQNGIALVNPDTIAHTVNLGGTFKKIAGRVGYSDTTVNNGASVTSVTLQPQTASSCCAREPPRRLRLLPTPPRHRSRPA